MYVYMYGKYSAGSDLNIPHSQDGDKIMSSL